MKKAVLQIGLLFPLMLLDGWVLRTLWGWFVASTFHLPALSIPVAAGLSCTYGVVRTVAKLPYDDFWENVVLNLFRLAAFLGFGYLFHLMAG